MKLSKFKKGDVISVTWIDSMATGRWYNEKEIDSWEKKKENCHSIGFFYNATKDFLTIYQNVSPSEFGNLTQIPVKVITSAKLVKRLK